MTDKLILQILDVKQELEKVNGNPRVVVLNSNLFEREPVEGGMIPTVWGMRIEYQPLPKHIHFIIQDSYTNGDRIRSMSDEELARVLAEGCHGTIECPTMCGQYDEMIKSCASCWLGYLKQEAE